MVGEFVVIGLGMFGRHVALSLIEAGQSVLAVDRREEEVNRVASEIDAAVCADATDEEALRELQLDRMTCAVVAIGAESMEASILATALLRQIGVPRIVARSLSELHARVLYAVGAHEVVSPEVDMGRRLARRLAQPNVLERLELGEKAELAEIAVPEQFVDKSLVNLDVRRRFGVTVVALRRSGGVLPIIDGNERLRQEDVLVVLGHPDGIARLAALA
jgi:trk system potassium uptake protein TrkA